MPIACSTIADSDNIRALGLEPKIALRSDHPEVIKEAVRQGSGIGVLYQATIEPALKHGAFKALNVRGVDIEGQIYIVHHKTRPLSAHAEEFLSILREQRAKRSAEEARKVQPQRAQGSQKRKIRTRID